MTKEILFSWSGGKDSCSALHELMQKGYQIHSLITVMTEGFDRINIHGVRGSLLDLQATALGVDLKKVNIPQGATMEEYESRLNATLRQYAARGIDTIAFGDIFLDHVQYVRIRNLANVNFKGEFPLWKRDTAEAAKQFVDRGFRAVVVCVDPRYLDQTFVGRPYDRRFLDELPPEVDPCGEEGEFHTFVFDGPIFKRAVHHKIGSIVCRGTFYYADLLPDC